MSTTEKMPASSDAQDKGPETALHSSALSGGQDAGSQVQSRSGVSGWLRKNSFAPSFLKGAWAHPALGYLVAVVLQLAVVLALYAIFSLFPTFHFREGPLFLVILLIALGWGVGPGTVATLVGAFLLLFFIIPPAFSLVLMHSEDVFSLGLYIIVGMVISIIASNTQRARREAERLRHHLDAVIDAIPDTLVLYDRRGRRVQQNRGARYIGIHDNPSIPFAEMQDRLKIRKTSGELFPQDTLPLSRALQGEVIVGAELIYSNPNSQQDRLVSVSAAPLYTADGKTIEGAVTVTHDLTERMQLEEQRRFLEEVSKALTSTLDYQETLANIARLIVPGLADWFSVDVVNDEGQIELVEIAHKDPEQVRWARELRERYPVAPDAPGGTPNVVRTGKSEFFPYISDEMLVASVEDEEMLAIVRQIGFTSAMTVPLVARGKAIGAVSLVSTESGKRYNERDLALAEELGRRAGVALDNARLYREAKEARDQLDIILQGVADGILVYNPKSEIVFANETAARMLGADSVQDLLNEPPMRAFSRYDVIDEHGQPFPPSKITHRRVLAGELEAESIIGYNDKETGRPERWSFVKSRPVFDNEGSVSLIITIVHDITERMQAEKRKDEFISMTSHELKTPVTSLKGFTNVLQRRLVKQGDEQGLHFLARMDAQLDKLTKLISDLLDISKMQAGKLSLQMEPFELDVLLKETVENVQAATTTHQLRIEGSTQGYVFGDEDRLGQVFINLLTNAIKYSPHAEKVLVHLSSDQEQAVVSVQDFGIGINESQHEIIFERFYQVVDPEEKTYPGLGMGLYISREIVERHHGRIWVESKKGHGSTFFVSLPLLQIEHEKPVPASQSEEKEMGE
jgi:PAS domain S-box-containing protein